MAQSLLEGRSCPRGGTDSLIDWHVPISGYGTRHPELLSGSFAIPPESATLL